MHPIEHLRYVARAAGEGPALLAREAAGALATFNDDPAGLVTACAIVGLDSVAFAAEAGAQAITWLVISLVIFLIPYGMLVGVCGGTLAP